MLNVSLGMFYGASSSLLCFCESHWYSWSLHITVLSQVFGEELFIIEDVFNWLIYTSAKQHDGPQNAVQMKRKHLNGRELFRAEM